MDRRISRSSTWLPSAPSRPPRCSETGRASSRKRGVKSVETSVRAQYGIRDAHELLECRRVLSGLAAAMNGIALHGGLIPYGGTFLVFTDYCRPAIRLSALMGLRVVYVMTHDSIGLGEDGPTHQPVEHLAALRAIPNLKVFRPADAVETAECWELALQSEHGPSVLDRKSTRLNSSH